MSPPFRWGDNKAEWAVNQNRNSHQEANHWSSRRTGGLPWKNHSYFFHEPLQSAEKTFLPNCNRWDMCWLHHFSKWCRGRVDLFNSSEVFLQDRFCREGVSLISKDCHPDYFLIRSCRDRLCCLLQLKLHKPWRRKWVDLARVTRSHPFGVSTSD